MGHKLRLPGLNVSSVEYKLLSIGGDEGDPLINGLTLSNSFFVAKNGNDTTAKPDRLDMPYLTLAAALIAATADGGGTIFMFPGVYNGGSNLISITGSQTIVIHAMGAVTIQSQSINITSGSTVSLAGRISWINTLVGDGACFTLSSGSTLFGSLGLLQHHAQSIANGGGNTVLDLKIILGGGIQTTQNGTTKIRVDQHIFLPGLGSGGNYEVIDGGICDVEAIELLNINGLGSSNSSIAVVNSGGYFRCRCNRMYSNSYACILIDNSIAVPVGAQSLYSRADIITGRIANNGLIAPISFNHDNANPAPAIALHGGVVVFAADAVNSIERLTAAGVPIVDLYGHIITNKVEDGTSLIAGGTLIVDATIQV